MPPRTVKVTLMPRRVVVVDIEAWAAEFGCMATAAAVRHDVLAYYWHDVILGSYPLTSGLAAVDLPSAVDLGLSERHQGNGPACGAVYADFDPMVCTLAAGHDGAHRSPVGDGFVQWRHV